MLTNAQRAARAGKLTGSRVAALMTGDAVKIDRLYREMIGEQPEEDLSDNFQVRLGEISEPLNIEWFERKQRSPVTRVGEVVTHMTLPWAACTLDGWSLELECPIECKHVGGREPLEVIIDRYQPQMQWAMEVTGADQCALSVIVGTAEPVIEFIKRDTGYADEMVKRGAQFMRHVEKKIPPVKLEPMPAPVEAAKIYDMSADEVWKSAAGRWLQSYGAAQTAKDCEGILKHLVPPDAAKAHGCGVRITRDRRGYLSLREARE